MPDLTDDASKLITEFDGLTRAGATDSMAMSESTNRALLITIGKGVFLILRLLAKQSAGGAPS